MVGCIATASIATLLCCPTGDYLQVFLQRILVWNIIQKEILYRKWDWTPRETVIPKQNSSNSHINLALQSLAIYLLLISTTSLYTSELQTVVVFFHEHLCFANEISIFFS